MTDAQPYEPTSEQQEFIRSLAERYVPPATMVVVFQKRFGVVLSEAELLEYFRHDLEIGKATADVAIADTIAKSARAGNPTLLIYLSKVHLGWTEKTPPKNPDSDMKTIEALPDESTMAKILRIPVRSSPRS